MNVCHFIRKSSQFKSSFINNQISNHNRYTPFLIFRLQRIKEYDAGFSVFKKKIDLLDLQKNEKNLERLLYKGPKILSSCQTNEIMQFIVKNSIDICHFHYGTDCGVYFPLLKKLTLPSVVSFYGYDYSSFSKAFLGYGKLYLRNRVFKYVTKVLAMSPAMKEELINLGCPEEKVIIHYYGTDTQKFIYKRVYEKKEKINLFILASLVPKKGHFFLLQSLKEIIKKGHKNLHLTILGTGELKEKIRKYILENELDDFISMSGPVQYGSEAMMAAFKQADIFIHPSITAPNGDKEGVPGAIIEAMAAGLPIISTNHAGIPFIIEQGVTGLLCEENDVESLTSNILMLAEDQKLRKRVGKNAQKFAVEKLDIKEKEKELEAIYDEIVSETK